jgi:hypothetical protein
MGNVAIIILADENSASHSIGKTAYPFQIVVMPTSFPFYVL